MRYVLSEGSFCEYGSIDELIRVLRIKISAERKKYEKEFPKNHKDLIADVKITFYEGAKND